MCFNLLAKKKNSIWKIEGFFFLIIHIHSHAYYKAVDAMKTSEWCKDKVLHPSTMTVTDSTPRKQNQLSCLGEKDGVISY